MPDPILISLFNTIEEVIRSEEDSLNKLNLGIFFAPELAIAYLMGKKIYSNREVIFNTNKEQVTWKREYCFEDAGPSDIVFEVKMDNEVRTYVIEIKIRDTIDSYQRDIEKLQRLPIDHVKLFCALSDIFNEEHDGRYRALKEISNLTLVKKENIPTNYSNYRRTVNCLLSLWLINPFTHSA